MGTRWVVLYGEFPPVVVIRVPLKGVRWTTLMQAAQRLVKRITNTPRHKPAPYWNVDGPPEDWDPLTSQVTQCFEYKDGEFVVVEKEN